MSISGKNRCELEIIAEMLSIAKNDVKKTRLLYQANLCYSNFIKYAEFLLEKEFLGVDLEYSIMLDDD